MEKLNIMDSWFIDWLIKEKNLDFMQYQHLSQEELDEFEKEFIEMYQAI